MPITHDLSSCIETTLKRRARCMCGKILKKGDRVYQATFDNVEHNKFYTRKFFCSKKCIPSSIEYGITSPEHLKHNKTMKGL